MMVDTAAGSERDNFNKNMKCPETETSNNNYRPTSDNTGNKTIPAAIKHQT